MTSEPDNTRLTMTGVTLDYPVYGVSSKALSRKLVQAATGGMLGTGDGRIVTVRALDGITLDIKAGERIGLYGHNGSGKTSLLRLMAQIMEPTAGTITATGRILPIININVGLHPDLTGREVARIRLKLDGCPRDRLEPLLAEILDFAELGTFADLPIRTYSSGMTMRLLFSIVTTQRPDILLLDEWLSVADVAFVEKAERRMHELMLSTGIVVLASHSAEVLRRWCTSICHLQHGRIVGIEMIMP